MTNPKHSSQSQNWYTPMGIIERSKAVMGTIDLDPASDPFGNSRLEARKYYTEEADGLTKPWGSPEDPGVVFCNPPGGVKDGNKSQPLMFWQKLTEELDKGHIKVAMFLAFSIEQLQSSQKCANPMTNHYLCIPKRRIQFEDAQGQKAKSPTHASAIILVRGKTASLASATLFFVMFHPLGSILMPHMRLTSAAEVL